MSAIKGLHFTRRDALTLQYLRWHVWRFGYAPTRKELGAAMGIGETGASRRVRKLSLMGLIRVDSCWRGIRLPSEGGRP